MKSEKTSEMKIGYLPSLPLLSPT